MAVKGGTSDRAGYEDRVTVRFADRHPIAANLECEARLRIQEDIF